MTDAANTREERHPRMSENADIIAYLRSLVFDDIKVTTKTFVVILSRKLDLHRLFHLLPLAVVDLDDDEQMLQRSSSITFIKLRDMVRGVNPKPLKKKVTKKQKQLQQLQQQQTPLPTIIPAPPPLVVVPVKKPRYFRNSLTTVVQTADNLRANIKICQNGVLQMTGCKTTSHAIAIVQHLCQYFESILSNFGLRDGRQYVVAFIPSMRNIDFSLGFNVDREKLAYMVTQYESFYCLLETSFGYTGVNIKSPTLDDLSTVDTLTMTRDLAKKTFTVDPSLYNTYLDAQPPKIQKKKLNKARYNTFLVFHSGKTIMSGMTSATMTKTFYEFIDVVCENVDFVKEKIIPLPERRRPQKK
jgi:TATA-box binding protein (TBP) (component of TFIID and TFIIIB)